MYVQTVDEEDYSSQIIIEPREKEGNVIKCEILPTNNDGYIEFWSRHKSNPMHPRYVFQDIFGKTCSVSFYRSPITIDDAGTWKIRSTYGSNNTFEDSIILYVKKVSIFF